MDPPAVLDRVLFDLEADPAESVDIAGREPEVVAALERDLAAYRAAAERWSAERAAARTS